MSVIDDVLRKEPEYRSIDFCLRHDLRERWVKAQARAATTKMLLDKTPSSKEARQEHNAAVAELDLLREEVGPEMLHFKFRSLAREEFDAVKAQHRPTHAAITDARKNGTGTPEWATSFQPALVAAACCLLRGPSGEQDHLSAEEAVAIWSSDRWNEAEKSELFHTALGAYVSRTTMRDTDLGND